VHLFRFITRIYHDARSSKCQMRTLPIFSPALEPGVTETTLLALLQHSPILLFIPALPWRIRLKQCYKGRLSSIGMM
jgi:hypothetical protein